MSISNLDQFIGATFTRVFARKVFASGGFLATTPNYGDAFIVPGAPGPGATPPARTAGSGYSCSYSTVGRLPVGSSAGTLVGVSAFGYSEQISIYDRLWACSGFSGASALLQSITTPGNLPSRDALGASNGAKCELWLTVYTPLGATPVTATATYTNSDGLPGRTATLVTTASPGTALTSIFALQGDDTGVQQVQSVQLSGSTGTAGDFGVTIARRLCSFTTCFNTQGSAQVKNFVELGMPAVHADSCISFLHNNTSSSPGGAFIVVAR